MADWKAGLLRANITSRWRTKLIPSLLDSNVLQFLKEKRFWRASKLKQSLVNTSKMISISKDLMKKLFQSDQMKPKTLQVLLARLETETSCQSTSRFKNSERISKSLGLLYWMMVYLKKLTNQHWLKFLKLQKSVLWLLFKILLDQLKTSQLLSTVSKQNFSRNSLKPIPKCGKAICTSIRTTLIKTQPAETAKSQRWCNQLTTKKVISKNWTRKKKPRRAVCSSSTNSIEMPFDSGPCSKLGVTTQWFKKGKTGLTLTLITDFTVEDNDCSSRAGDKLFINGSKTNWTLKETLRG